MNSWQQALAGKLAEFVGGPMDGDRFELPGWALMHDGAVAMPEQTTASFLRHLDLSALRVVVYRPDLVEGEGNKVRLTPDGKALRYLLVTDDSGKP